jgi:hypothetical protein
VPDKLLRLSVPMMVVMVFFSPESTGLARPGQYRHAHSRNFRATVVD